MLPMKQSSLKALFLATMVVVIPTTLVFSSFRIYEGLRRQFREPDSITLRIVDLSGRPRPRVQVTFSEWGWRYWMPLPYTGRTSNKHVWTQTSDADGRITVRWKDDFLEINELEQNGTKFPFVFETRHKFDGTISPPAAATGLGGTVAQYGLHHDTLIEYATASELKYNDIK